MAALPALGIMGGLEAGLFRSQSSYCKDIIEEAVALLESLAINHPFIDGNKRAAFAACYVFFCINGFFIADSADNVYAFLMTLFNNNQFHKEVLEPWLRSKVKGQEK